MVTFEWFAPLTSIKGVGEKQAQRLAKLALFTQGDLLLHCPFRYEDRTHITPIKDIVPDKWVLIQGKITQLKVQTKGKKRCTLTLADQSGTIKVVFFHFQSTQLQQWQIGKILRCFGQPKLTSQLQLIHPDYEVFSEDALAPLPVYLTAVYPTVAGISQFWLRKHINLLLDDYLIVQKNAPDYFASTLDVTMLKWNEALATIHRPLAEQAQALIQRTHSAFTRLIAEELFAHRRGLKQIRANMNQHTANPLLVNSSLLNQFLKNLPFTLTQAQQQVWNSLKSDLEKTVPMLRLVQGDVGCGKTVVAALAALTALASHSQVALMAPTEILAEQHYQQFSAWFSVLGYRCQLLTGKLKTRARRSIQENVTLGLTHIVIGTHALFQEQLQFQDLGLVIIDEQHRFGVQQRLALQIKGLSARQANYPHQLVMTATPIPRTLAMSQYAHLDISVINSLPPGRQPITTVAMPQTRRDEIIERMKQLCEKGQQVYWVCTLINDSEQLTCQAAQASAQMLQAQLPFTVGLIHGKMSCEEKETVMQGFYQGTIAVLVATTVIEVGVNVPNATLMIIENPERLGLAQLHQLRGRVGRGNSASFCILLYQPPLTEIAQARLKIMRESNDGFVIAEVDLQLRGPGEILGAKQTGAVQFKVADFHRDKPLIEKLPHWDKLLKTLPADEVEQIIQRWCTAHECAQA